MDCAGQANLAEDENPENTENRQESCNKASLVTCEELVADFAFLSMSKVMLYMSEFKELFNYL